MSDLRTAAQQALELLLTRRMGAEKVIDDLRAALAEPVQEPDMRHPKIQALIGSIARKNIEMLLVKQLLKDGPDLELTSMDMEYWNSTHDKLREALMRTAEAASDERERCAKLCEAQLDEPTSREWNMAIKCCAATLRA